MVTQVYVSETRKFNLDFPLSLGRGKNDDPYSSKSKKKSVKLLFNMYKNYTKLIRNEIRRISDQRLKEMISNNLKTLLNEQKSLRHFTSYRSQWEVFLTFKVKTVGLTQIIE